MEAKSVNQIPSGEWLYEPKWDGFRGLSFRDKHQVAIQSKAGHPLDRYFPEVVEVLQALPETDFVLDGEIVIIHSGKLDFDLLLQRIHPAESRIRRLAQETPATYLVFDLLLDQGKSLLAKTLETRRRALQQFMGRNQVSHDRVRLSPASCEVAVAERWMKELAGIGCDGVVAKRRDLSYLSGARAGMVKVKRMRTADCVVGGLRYSSKGENVGSLLLGLYDEQGLLHHVGFTSSFSRQQRAQLKKILEPLIHPPGFTGRAPGGPSRWSTKRSGDWKPLQPKLVCEVKWDHFSGTRFRHGTRFLRWRPEKAPSQCTMEQVILPKAAILDRLLER